MGICPVSVSPTCYYATECYDETDTDFYSSNFEGECADLDSLNCQITLGVAVW